MCTLEDMLRKRGSLQGLGAQRGEEGKWGATVGSLLNPASLDDTTMAQLKKPSLGRRDQPKVTEGVRAGFKEEPLYHTRSCHGTLAMSSSYLSSSASTILRSRMEDSVMEWPAQSYP